MAADAGFAVWLTGMPASGKTTLAHALQTHLAAQGIPAILLDSDDLRPILTPQPTYTPDERDRFYAILGQLAAWLTRQGLNVLIAATANRRAYRDQARRLIPRFAEVYVACSLATCQARDPKGIYARAQAAAQDTVPGLGAAYEPPLTPEATINTEALSPAAAAAAVLTQLPEDVVNGY